MSEEKRDYVPESDGPVLLSAFYKGTKGEGLLEGVTFIYKASNREVDAARINHLKWIKIEDKEYVIFAHEEHDEAHNSDDARSDELAHFLFVSTEATMFFEDQ